MKLVEKIKGFGKKEVELTPMEAEINALVESLNAISPDDPNYKLILDNIEQAMRINNELKGKKEKPERTIGDPRLLSAIITTVGGIAWGVVCLVYDKSGEIIPTRLFAQGPKIPNPKV